MKRIITCQGSIQLVSALSAMHYRDPAPTDENYLVIYDLYAPGGQSDRFAAFLDRMATSVCQWRKIVYLTPDWLSAIAGRLDSTSPDTIFQAVHQMLGIAIADEIYLCRNWQSGNQLLMNAYQSAIKVCYGDSIGIYFSETSAIVAAGKAPLTEPARSINVQIAHALGRLKQTLKLKTTLQTIPFDIGYFALPEIVGEVPPMPTVVLDRSRILDTFQTFNPLIDPAYLSQIRSQIADTPVTILLTSNLSEGDRLSQTQEIEAYRQWLIAQAIKPGSTLIIKPHPRDNTAKIERLKQSVSDLFEQVITLTEPQLFFLPFEVFFAAVFADRPSSEIRLFAVSSACLSIKLLFDVASAIGFGVDLTPQLFKPDQVEARLEHEQILRHALQHIDRLCPVSSVL